LKCANRYHVPVIASSDDEAATAFFETLGGNARPLGDAAFLARAESFLGRSLARLRGFVVGKRDFAIFGDA